MLKAAVLAVSLLSLSAMPAAVNAAPCKDAKGKFIKCPDKKPVRCKLNGKFAKCSTPGAKPA